MRDRFRLLWAIVAVALVASTAPLDFETLFADAGAARDRSWPPSSDGLVPQRATPVPPLRYDLCPGDSKTLSYRVRMPPAPLQADILFAFDTTGSMDEVISAGQQSAVEIMSDLEALIGDVQFGLVDFRDYPREPYGRSVDWPYRLRQSLTHQTSDMRTSINQLEADGGLDAAEAYSRVLYEAYADERIGWRPSVRHFIIMFGDSVPHDDDLNADIPSPPPHRPGEWKTGYPLDPGRDGQDGTDDDLDFQSVLGILRERSMTLLVIVSDAHLMLGVTVDDLLMYWQTWAGMTGPGGDAKILEDAESLPATIQSLVADAVRHVNRLSVDVVPSPFDEWVTVDPSGYDDVVIPLEGLDLDFVLVIAVPPSTPAGQYNFELVAKGDGTVYVRQPVQITVPASCFPTPTPTWVPLPTPRPRWTLYLPFVVSDYTSW